MSGGGKDGEKTGLVTRTIATAFRATRPPFHMAVHVLYWALFSVPGAWAVVIVRRLFGEQVQVNYELLGYFAAPMGAGALASAAYELACSGKRNPWLSTSLFGAVAGLLFSILADLRNADSVNVGVASVAGIALAAVFVLLRWLMLKESQTRVA